MKKAKNLLLQRLGGHRLTTKYGEVQVNGFSFGDSQQIVIAISSIEVEKESSHLLRIQYGCEYGAVYGSRDCDCGLQIDAGLKIIAASKGGTLLYFRDHEARGFGLAGKIRMTELEKANNWSAQETERALGLVGSRPDVLWTVPEILRQLEIVGAVTLLGINEQRKNRLTQMGVEVDGVRPLDVKTDTLTRFALLDVESVTGCKR